MTITLRGLGLMLVGLAFLAATSGAEAACIKLRKIADFEQIRTNLTGSFCLAKDIDASAVANFVPIGNDTPFFSGTLDGRGFVIRNLTISSLAEHVGLFGRIDNGGKVKNLGLVDVNVTGASEHRQNVGALAGWLASGSIAKAFASGPVTGNGFTSRVGGLVGWLYGPLTDSYATGPVSGIGPVPPPVAGGGIVGGLVGQTASAGNIARSYATGTVTGGDFATVGGLVGHAAGTEVTQSYATGTAQGGNNAAVGGLAGWASGAVISKSYATGEARGGFADGGVPDIGGLVGHLTGSTITRSFALGFARGGQNGNGQANVGGLVGTHFGNLISQSYAAGRVFGGPNSHTRIGGLVGSYFASPNTIQQSYAVGSVEGGGGAGAGGLTGGTQTSAPASYWDVETSGHTTSFGGVGRTTKQLKAKPPAGFGNNVWSITPGVSYPFLTDPGLNFSGALAIVVRQRTDLEARSRIYAFLPVSQLDQNQYAAPVENADQASLAAVYTMLARAIGITDDVSELNGVKIDTYFWDDATQQATWTGPVKQHAKLGAATPLGAQPIDDGNVIGALRKNRLVAILGTYDLPGGGTAPHAMLATSFTVTEGGAIETLVANDPWTGRQVRIDPATKRVISPTGFPLADFTVDQFQVVSFK